MTRIVTRPYRPKRAPRKRKSAPLVGPIVTKASRRKVADKLSIKPEPTPPPANDNRPAEPVPPAEKSAIVTSANRKRTKVRREAEPDDPEADAAMQAWLERAKWGGPVR